MRTYGLIFKVWFIAAPLLNPVTTYFAQDWPDSGIFFSVTTIKNIGTSY